MVYVYQKIFCKEPILRSLTNEEIQLLEDINQETFHFCPGSPKLFSLVFLYRISLYYFYHFQAKGIIVNCIGNFHEGT